MDKVLRYLEEWKEKILFAVVLLVTVVIALKARPVGGGVLDIDAEMREAGITASGVDRKHAELALRLLENPADFTPTQPDVAEINRPFYDDAHVYRRTRASAWSLTVAQYEGLPPIRLEAPAFSTMQDFDVPAGVRPSVERVPGLIPRDKRKVDLREEKGSEFGE